MCTCATWIATPRGGDGIQIHQPSEAEDWGLDKGKRPCCCPGREVQAPVDASSASNNAEDTLPTKTPVSIELERADAEAKMPSEQPSSAPSATFHVATAAPARARIRAARPIARPRFAFARLQTKITSHRREVSRNRMAEVHEIAPTASVFRPTVTTVPTPGTVALAVSSAPGMQGLTKAWRADPPNRCESSCLDRSIMPVGAPARGPPTPWQHLAAATLCDVSVPPRPTRSPRSR